MPGSAHRVATLGFAHGAEVGIFCANADRDVPRSRAQTPWIDKGGPLNSPQVGPDLAKILTRYDGPQRGSASSLMPSPSSRGGCRSPRRFQMTRPKHFVVRSAVLRARALGIDGIQGFTHSRGQATSRGFGQRRTRGTIGVRRDRRRCFDPVQSFRKTDCVAAISAGVLQCSDLVRPASIPIEISRQMRPWEPPR